MTGQRRLPFDDVEALLRDELGQTFTAASAWVGVDGRRVFEAAVGTLGARSARPTRDRTRFDLASLTKPLATTTLAMLAIDEGLASLDQPLGDAWAPAARAPLGDATLADLLGHRSGLPDWSPFYEELAGGTPSLRPRSRQAQAAYKKWVLAAPLATPLGQRALYSDLGYMALGWWLEDLFQAPLSVAFQERIAGVWGLEETGYTAPDSDEVPATEACPWRGRTIRGEVHDENAWAYGAPMGHAGLFGSARDVGAWGAAVLQSLDGRGPIRPDTLESFWAEHPARPSDNYEPSTWRLGFDTPSEEGSSAGANASRRAYGHLGFTGCSLWIDVPRRAVAVLLTNRVHLGRENRRIRDVRPAFHDRVWAALDAVGS